MDCEGKRSRIVPVAANATELDNRSGRPEAVLHEEQVEPALGNVPTHVKRALASRRNPPRPLDSTAGEWKRKPALVGDY